MNFKYENRKELVIIDPTKLKIIEEQYNNIFKIYGGHITELMLKIKDLEHSKELCIKDNNLLEKEIEIKNLEINLLKINKK
jgi:hypothetical protein